MNFVRRIILNNSTTDKIEVDETGHDVPSSFFYFVAYKITMLKYITRRTIYENI